VKDYEPGVGKAIQAAHKILPRHFASVRDVALPEGRGKKRQRDFAGEVASSFGSWSARDA